MPTLPSADLKLALNAISNRFDIGIAAEEPDGMVFLNPASREIP
jgi:hypothetical protein